MIIATGGFIENFFNDPFSYLWKIMGVILAVIGIIAVREGTNQGILRRLT